MIGRTNVSSGGGGLNFSVVGGTTTPNAKENTIWINTATKVSTYAFAAENPFTAPAEGAVWILTADSSSVVFNALKKYILQVYPVSAQQFVGGAWVIVEAMIYQNGAWQVWWSGQLYDAGNEWISVTGGWITGGLKQGSANAATAPYVNKGADSVVVSQAKSGSDGNGGYLATALDIDVTDYTSIHFNVTGLSLGSSNNNMGFMVFDRSISVLGYNFNYATAFTKLTTSSTDGIYTIDVSSVTGAYAVGAYLYNGASSTTPTITIHKVWME